MTDEDLRDKVTAFLKEECGAEGFALLLYLPRRDCSISLVHAYPLDAAASQFAELFSATHKPRAANVN